MLIFDLYFLFIGLILELIVSSRVRSEHHILADLFPPECHCLRVRVIETVCAEGSEVLLQKIHQRAATLVQGVLFQLFFIYLLFCVTTSKNPTFLGIQIAHSCFSSLSHRKICHLHLLFFDKCLLGF